MFLTVSSGYIAIVESMVLNGGISPISFRTAQTNTASYTLIYNPPLVTSNSGTIGSLLVGNQFFGYPFLSISAQNNGTLLTPQALLIALDAPANFLLFSSPASGTIKTPFNIKGGDLGSPSTQYVTSLRISDANGGNIEKIPVNLLVTNSDTILAVFVPGPAFQSTPNLLVQAYFGSVPLAAIALSITLQTNVPGIFLSTQPLALIAGSPLQIFGENTGTTAVSIDSLRVTVPGSKISTVITFPFITIIGQSTESELLTTWTPDCSFTFVPSVVVQAQLAGIAVPFPLNVKATTKKFDLLLPTLGLSPNKCRFCKGEILQFLFVPHNCSYAGKTFVKIQIFAAKCLIYRAASLTFSDITPQIIILSQQWKVPRSCTTLTLNYTAIILGQRKTMKSLIKVYS